MSNTLNTNSKTELVIAIDDEESHSGNDVICGSEVTTDEIISQTLNQIIDSIESLPKIDKMGFESVSDYIEIDDNDSDTEYIDERDVNQSSQTINISSDERAINDLMRPLEDVDNYSEFDEMDEDLEGEDEDCMIIDFITSNQFQKRTDSPKSPQLDDHNNNQTYDNSIPEDNDQTCGDNCEEVTEEVMEEVITLSDSEEEECLIINDSFSNKLNRMIGSDGPIRVKRSNSPIYSSQSFIPLSEPSTSCGTASTSQPVPRYRGFQNASRRPQQSPNNSYNSWTSSTSLTDLFLTPLTPNYIQSPSEPIRVSSTYLPIPTNNSEEDSYIYDESIPFLYEESKPSTSNDTIGSSNDVRDVDIISEMVKMDRSIVQNVLNLIEDQCTVPFIVRYRQSVISGIDADRVRKINNVYNELKSARQRAKDVEQALKKQDRLDPRLKAALNRCKNVFEVEHIYRLCRNESENAERFRNLGLGDSAVSVLEGKRLDPNHFLNRFAFGLDSVDKVKEGWCAIIADIISKDCDVLEFLIKATKQYIPTLQTTFNNERSYQLTADLNPKNKDLIQKYLRFKKFKKPIDKINAHSYMAIERGEAIDFCVLKWNRCIAHFLVDCVRIAFNNQLKPSLTEYIRWELRHTSHMTALDVFRDNVKQLLLEPPLRDEFVVGVDPGRNSGYKVAVVSPWLVPLDTCIIKLDANNYETSAQKLRKIMIDNRCSIIALGNGTGCRMFEDMLIEKIKSGFFGKINVKYKIINESGVSWYSVTEEAKRDLPQFPPQMIGAISIARKLIDPLSELVKVDPKRLQVGMYMRDIEEEAVKKAFHEVAVECVSLCGVDVNRAPFELLSKVAGLEPTIARIIIDKRERDGLFNSRSQLKNIDGIGWKQFEQCAGFIKVMKETSRDTLNPLRRDGNNEFPNKRSATSSTDDYDPLDSTIVHPESYFCANTYLELIGASKDEIGKRSILLKVEKANDKYSLPEIAQLCNTHTANMKLIIEGLTNSLDFDYRSNFVQIYIPDIQNFEDLTIGMRLKGRVVNVTPMGAFIDCGLVGGTNAYLKASECERHSIAVNDNVLVTIESINKIQYRFSVNIIEVIKSNGN